MKTFGSLGIAIAVGAGLFILLALAEATTPGLAFGPVKFMLPLVLGGGLYTVLSRWAGNRKASVADASRKSELLSFPPRPGYGWVAVMRDKSTATASMASTFPSTTP